ncbi:hypothetical protein NO559_08665 [Dasania sp. GY-MA-18]|uniref:Uncharacterized protein n=1 Tax=Dasania phycosphaerae TaxID=2950436 RepID=A0A9J6RM60_9GAMM|nr:MULTISPECIES: hypothetical protein [Dasania]MCR8922841.1 hypothetical protein [Dasania sp. GY-MA-18]MCZ0865272.1 hypothetical protein [Dasania phycosphaerae]MCZ0868997.1 hypothetical protein [Dasania phycosphaerae]
MNDYDDDIELDADDFDDSADDYVEEESKKTLFTNRRRELEDRIELWKLRDELGIYDDDLYA